MRKISMLLILIFTVIFAFKGNVSAFAKNGQECSKCHTLTTDQAGQILGILVPDIKILHVKTSPITALWEIGFETGGRKAIVYLDFAKKHIISPATGGNIIDLQSKANLTQESFLEISKIDVSRVSLTNALVMGDKNAEHKIIVFDDPD